MFHIYILLVFWLVASRVGPQPRYAESYIHDLLYISNTFMTGIPRFLYFRIREKVESTNEHRPEHAVSVSSDVSVANPTANQTLAGIE